MGEREEMNQNGEISRRTGRVERFTIDVKTTGVSEHKISLTYHLIYFKKFICFTLVL